MKRDLAIAAIFILIGIAGWTFRQTLSRVWRGFWDRPIHPFNLAIFRIAVFATLLWTLNTENPAFFASLNPDLQYPPQPFANFHFAAWHVGALTVLFRVACIFGILGIFTRTSALVVTALGLYLLGIPQWFGKVNHYHHLLWFSALLTFCRSGETLGFDGIWASWRRADRHDVDIPKPSIEFSRPINWAILLLGLCYFFPAFWKLVNVGPAWLLPKNIVDMAHNDWFTMGYQLPAVRLDSIPILMSMGAVFTVCLELLFLPGAIWKSSRSYVAAAGLVFHNMTSATLGIQFYWIQSMYAVFVDWHKLFKGLGKRVFGEPLVIAYDGDCNFCRRAIASLRTLDLMDQLRPIPGQNRDQLAIDLTDAPTEEGLRFDIFALDTGRWYKGTNAYRRIFRRSPLLWPLWLLIVLPGTKQLGTAIYRWAREARSYLVQGSHVDRPLPRTPVRILAALAGALLLINTYFGFKHHVNAWPFACYPPYDFVAGDQSEYVLWTVDRRTFNPMTDPALTNAFHRNRLNALLMKVAHDPAGDRKMREIFALWCSLTNHSATGSFSAQLCSGPNDPALWQSRPSRSVTLTR